MHSEMLLRGDVEGLFEKLHQKYLERGYRMTGNYHDAAELVDGLFLRMLKSQIINTNPEGWLDRVFRNRIVDYYRGKRKEVTSSVLDENDEEEDFGIFSSQISEEEGPEDEAIREEARGMANKGLMALDMIDRYVLVRAYMDGCSCKNIGEELGRSSKAIKSQLSRAREKFKKLENGDIIYDL